MNYKVIVGSSLSLFVMLVAITACDRGLEQRSATKKNNDIAQPMRLQIIVGSVRATSTGENIAKTLKALVDARLEVVTEVVRIKDYNLPFYTDEVAPASRQEEITDPILKRWSDKIKQADAYIIVVPEYNAGYPGPLKNALDSLYKEWNNKPVAFVGYSGGSSGAALALTQLRQVVAQGLNMITIDTDIQISQSWKACDASGTLVKSGLEQEVNLVVDQLLLAKNTAH